MKKGTIILFVLFMMLAVPALCQQKLVLNNAGNQTLSKFLVQNLDARNLYAPLSKDTILRTALTFNLNSDGIVNKVAAFFGNTQTLNDEAARLLMLTSGKWDSTGLKESQTIVLPLIIASPDQTPAFTKPFVEREIARLRQVSNQLTANDGEQSYVILEPLIIYIATSK